MSYPDPKACAAIGRIRARNRDVSQRKLARQIYAADFVTGSDMDDACDISINDTLASTYARLRRYDAKQAAAVA